MTKRDNTAKCYDSKFAELSEHEEKYWRYNQHLQKMRGRHLIDEDFTNTKIHEPKQSTGTALDYALFIVFVVLPACFGIGLLILG